MMKKIDDEWICPSCSPEDAEPTSATQKAVVVTCPVCNKQQLYCGVGGELSAIKWKQGVDDHLDHHEIDCERKESYRRKALTEKETTEVPQSLCEESDTRGWDNYGL